MDKNLIHNQFMNIGVIINIRNSTDPLYGVIMGFEPEPFNKMNHWLFLKNLDKEHYNKTKDSSLFIPIEHSDIISIDFQIP